MNIDKIEKVNFTRLEQEVMKLIRKHADNNKDLEDDLHSLIEVIQEERSHHDEIRSLAFTLANKI